MTEFIVVAKHPVDLADGRMVGPGEVLTDKQFDLTKHHNVQLIETGQVLAQGDEEIHAPSEPTDPAKRKALELGVKIDEISGTGKDGRVTVEDVEKAAEEGENS